MLTIAPMKPMKRSTAPVAKTTRATRAPSIEVMKFFMKELKVPAFRPSTSRNRRCQVVTQERVASPAPEAKVLCMSEQKELLTTGQKALTINLDPAKYGTFAEIGAGQ